MRGLLVVWMGLAACGQGASQKETSPEKPATEGVETPAMGDVFVVNATSEEAVVYVVGPTPVDCIHLEYPGLIDYLGGDATELVLAPDSVSSPWEFEEGHRCHAVNMWGSEAFVLKTFDLDLPLQQSVLPLEHNTLTIVEGSEPGLFAFEGGDGDEVPPVCRASRPDWSNSTSQVGQAEVFSLTTREDGCIEAYLPTGSPGWRIDDWGVIMCNFPDLGFGEGDTIHLSVDEFLFRAETPAGELLLELGRETLPPEWMGASSPGWGSDVCSFDDWDCGFAINTDLTFDVNGTSLEATWGDEVVMDGPDGPVVVKLYDARKHVEKPECGLVLTYAMWPAP